MRSRNSSMRSSTGGSTEGSTRSRNSSLRSSTGSTTGDIVAMGMKEMAPHEMLTLLENMAGTNNEVAYEAFQSLKNSPAVTPSRKNKSKGRSSTKSKRSSLPNSLE